MRLSKQTTVMGEIIATFAAFILIMLAALIWLDTPVMQVSRDGSCVQVFSPSGTHSCQNPPKRYTREIVHGG